MQLLPGLILHTENSQFTPDAEAVLRDGSTWRLRSNPLKLATPGLCSLSEGHGQSFRLFPLHPGAFSQVSPVINVVRLHGAIGVGSPLRPPLTAKDLDPLLERAFTKNIAAVALSVNSPGGSPVQSALIHSRIRALAAEFKIPVYVFCEDVAASGGYWLACAGDEIYADESSIVGSIGVISAGFGFVEAIGKLGVERRVHTSAKTSPSSIPSSPRSRKMLTAFWPSRPMSMAPSRPWCANAAPASSRAMKRKSFRRLLVRPPGPRPRPDRRHRPPA